MLLILFLLALAILWQWLELKQLRLTTYAVRKSGVQVPLSFAVLGDLHDFTYGKDNSRLFRMIKETSPDAILIPGDLMTSFYHKPANLEKGLFVLENLVQIAPVYYSYGNHESRIARRDGEEGKAYEAFYEKACALGVHFVNNTAAFFEKDGFRVEIAGLTIGREYFARGKKLTMEESYVKSLLPVKKEGDFRILLAHNPMYFPAYRCLRSDIVLSGHNHGGLVRIPGIGSIVSPQLELFPKYDAGRFDEEGQTLLVTRGAGTHTYHIRIFNRAEVLLVKVLPEETEHEHAI